MKFIDEDFFSRKGFNRTAKNVFIILALISLVSAYLSYVSNSNDSSDDQYNRSESSLPNPDTAYSSEVTDSITADTYSDLFSGCVTGLESSSKSTVEKNNYCGCVANYYDVNYSEKAIYGLGGNESYEANIGAVKDCSSEYKRLVDQYGESEADTILRSNSN